METQILNSLVGGSSAVVLAVIIFFFYRNDKNDEIKRWQEQSTKWEAQNKELIDCRNEENRTRDSLTKALTELTIAVKNSTKDKEDGQ
jgi:hypothetical protein